MTHIIERQLQQSRQHFFEQGDKAGRLLTQQARAVSASRLIPGIKSSSGGYIVDPTEISRSFAKF